MLDHRPVDDGSVNGLNSALRSIHEPAIIDAKRDAAQRVLDTLIAESGRRYHAIAANLEPILARLEEGYTETELRAIAVVKGRQWRADEKMQSYLRPQTLYNRSKCAAYRAELPAQKVSP